jgi:hypothetical protein
MTVSTHAHTAPTNDNSRERASTSPFLPPTTNNTQSSNPFDTPQVPPSAHSRDPDINSEVQDYARELSSLLNRMPSDILTPTIHGLRIQQPQSTTVPTSGLLGMGAAWPSPILSDRHSINPFDNLARLFAVSTVHGIN